jgi:hypothetical protein
MVIFRWQHRQTGRSFNWGKPAGLPYQTSVTVDDRHQGLDWGDEWPKKKRFDLVGFTWIFANSLGFFDDFSQIFAWAGMTIRKARRQEKAKAPDSKLPAPPKMTMYIFASHATLTRADEKKTGPSRFRPLFPSVMRNQSFVTINQVWTWHPSAAAARRNAFNTCNLDSASCREVSNRNCPNNPSAFFCNTANASGKV